MPRKKSKSPRKKLLPSGKMSSTSKKTRSSPGRKSSKSPPAKVPQKVQNKVLAIKYPISLQLKQSTGDNEKSVGKDKLSKPIENAKDHKMEQSPFARYNTGFSIPSSLGKGKLDKARGDTDLSKYSNVVAKQPSGKVSIGIKLTQTGKTLQGASLTTSGGTQTSGSPRQLSFSKIQSRIVSSPIRLAIANSDFSTNQSPNRSLSPEVASKNLSPSNLSSAFSKTSSASQSVLVRPVCRLLPATSDIYPSRLTASHDYSTFSPSLSGLIGRHKNSEAGDQSVPVVRKEPGVLGPALQPRQLTHEKYVATLAKDRIDDNRAIAALSQSSTHRPVRDPSRIQMTNSNAHPPMRKSEPHISEKSTVTPQKPREREAKNVTSFSSMQKHRGLGMQTMHANAALKYLEDSQDALRVSGNNNNDKNKKEAAATLRWIETPEENSAALEPIEIGADKLLDASYQTLHHCLAVCDRMEELRQLIRMNFERKQLGHSVLFKDRGDRGDRVNNLKKQKNVLIDAAVLEAGRILMYDSIDSMEIIGHHLAKLETMIAESELYSDALMSAACELKQAPNSDEKQAVRGSSPLALHTRSAKNVNNSTITRK